MLEVSDQHALERDLRQIHTMLSSGLPVAPEQTVPVGARVRITTGPLTGVEGTVIRRGKRDEFVAVVRFLGRVRDRRPARTGRSSRSRRYEHLFNWASAWLRRR